MSLGEFDLIERYFWRPPGQGARHSLVGNGDDCAVLTPAFGHHLAISTDTLVEGRHFLSTVDPARLGHKALAVNLSDLAACGARPLAFTLALTLPRVDEAWLTAFAQGLLALADAHDCELIGGDTTAGPLSIGITVMGEVKAGSALLRSGAQPGDDLWVSGFPGMARLALEGFRDTLEPPLSGLDFRLAREVLERPHPRVGLGLALQGVAHAAIDVSDGLLGDLGHVLRRSDVGAELALDALPVHTVLAHRARETQLDCILAGGDDYELLFTAAATDRDAVLARATQAGVSVSRIGRIQADPGLRLYAGPIDEPAEAGHRQWVDNRWTSFDHFKS